MFDLCTLVPTEPLGQVVDVKEYALNQLTWLYKELNKVGTEKKKTWS